MKNAFLANWKTTLAGIIVAGDAIIQAIAADLTSGATIPWKTLIVQFIIGIGLALAKDFNNITPAIVIIIALPLLNSCTSTTTQIVSGTLSNGDQFPLCLEVIQKTPFKVSLLAAFCATTQQEINVKTVEYRKVYPNAAITEYMGKESRKLN